MTLHGAPLACLHVGAIEHSNMSLSAINRTGLRDVGVLHTVMTRTFLSLVPDIQLSAIEDPSVCERTTSVC